MAKSQKKNIVKKKDLKKKVNKQLFSSEWCSSSYSLFFASFLLQVLSKYSARNINYFGDQGNVLN